MSAQEKPVYEFGPFRLDAAEHQLLRDGAPIAMPPKAFHTLEALVRRSGRLVDKDELLREVWPDSFVEEANLSMNVSVIRRALGEEAGTHQYIETVPKRGYRFVAPVRVLPTQTGGEKQNGSNGSHGVAAAEPPGVSEPAAAPTPGGASPAARRRRVAPIAGALVGLAALVAATVVATLAISDRLEPERPDFDFQRMKISKIAGTVRVDRAVVSPDGKYLAQLTVDAGRSSLSIRQLATTRTVEILPPSEAVYDGITFSPDGSFIYYVTLEAEASTAYRIPALGGRAIKVADGVDRAVAVSPDGLHIAYVKVDFASSDTRLVVAGADGAEPRTVVARGEDAPMLLGNAVWSPDGRRVACVESEISTPDRQGLVEVDVDDGSTRPIGGRDWKIIERVCWMPDGSGLLVAALPYGSMGKPFQIWRVAYPSGELRRVTNDLASYLELSVTADGKTLVATQSNSHSRIDVVPLDDPSNVSRRLVPGSSTLDGVQGLVWAPDGRIVYVTWGSGNSDIWSMNADGTGAVQLTDDAYREWWPDVSPDGRYVVYAANRGVGMAIWRVEVAGGPPVQLTDGPNDSRAMCARDGWVYFVRRVGPKTAIFKVPLAGGEPVEALGAPLRWATLSPDGSMFAELDSPAGVGSAIRIVSAADGREIRRFETRLVYMWNGLRWAPDGSGVAYVAPRDGATSVWFQPVSGGEPRRLTPPMADGTVTAAWSPDGKALACTRVTASTVVVTISDFR